MRQIFCDLAVLYWRPHVVAVMIKALPLPTSLWIGEFGFQIAE